MSTAPAGGARARWRRAVRLGLAVALAGAAALSGCGGGEPSPAPAGSGSAAAALRGHLTVLAAASLTAAFRAGETTLEAAAPGFAATYAFAGSQQLVAQVLQGAPADVVATADEPTMRRLTDAGLVTAPRAFARNQLEIVTAPGNPLHVAGLADLARPDLAVVLADASVPVGAAARQALDRAGVVVHPRSLELDVAAVVARVRSGEADAAIAYVTDAAVAGAALGAVPIPPEANVVTTDVVAVTRSPVDPGAAAAFVDAVVGGPVQAALRAHGFLPPP